MTWPEPTRVTIVPNNVFPIEVADVELEEDHDTLWVRIANIPSDDSCTFPYSYGLLTWVSSEGRELGTVKAFGHCESEVYKLGVGRAPLQRSGRLLFDARGYNLQWIDRGNPWTLEFQALSGRGSEGALPDLPALGTRATLGVLADLIGSGVSYSITGSEQPYALIRLIAR